MNQIKKSYFDSQKVAFSAVLVHALAHPLRLRLLAFIDSKGETEVKPIYQTLQLEQSITSQHLKVLRLAGVVKARKEGKYVFYSVAYNVIQRVPKAMDNYLKKTTSDALAA